MSAKEMQTYIADTANRLEDKRLLRLLYLRAVNLIALAEKEEAASGKEAPT